MSQDKKVSAVKNGKKNLKAIQGALSKLPDIDSPLAAFEGGLNAEPVKNQKRKDSSRGPRPIRPEEILGGAIIRKGGVVKRLDTPRTRGFGFVEFQDDTDEVLIERDLKKIEAIRAESQKDWNEIDELKKETKKLILEMQS